MRRIVFVLLCLIIAMLAGCDGYGEVSLQGAASAPAAVESTAPSTPPDLTGNWKQVNSNSETSYQEAVIEGDTIEVYWINDEDDSKALYWAGSYVAPTAASKEFSWDSVNDKSKTNTALLASGDDTKTFAYNNGELSYSVSAMGMTQTVKLEKQ